MVRDVRPAERSASTAVAELTSAYQRARMQVAVPAALLFLWRAGVEFEGPLPLLGVKVTTGKALPLLLCGVLAYAVLRLLVEWFQSDLVRRRRAASRIDLGASLGIAAAAAWVSAAALLPAFSLPLLSVFVPTVSLVVLGLAVGSVTATLLDSLQFIRSKEEAARLALPRYPVALRATFWMWCVVMVVTLFILLVAPAFAPPLSDLWPWLLGVPTSVLVLSHGISIALPRRTLADGSKITRREHIRRLRRAFDQHDTYYQQGGWDRRIAADDSPIYKAAETGDTEAVQRLLDSGAPPNRLNMHGWTPLMIAVAQRHHVTANLLLRRGADPNVANFIGRTPLMFASRYGLIEIVRDLIAFGADVNLNRSPDAGPLAIAAGEGHADVVHLLLAAGADVNIRDRDGHTALDCAQRGGHGEIAAVLRKRMQGGT